MTFSPFVRLLAVDAVVLLLTSCNGSDAPPPHGGAFVPDAGITSIARPLCVAARASEDLSPRADLTGVAMATAGGQQVVKTSDLYARFKTICGDCHVDQSNGGRHVDEASFATTFDATWLTAITSDDPKLFMPPPPTGKPFSSRAAGDAVVDLVKYLQAWLSQGRPASMFTVEGAATSTPGMADYTFSPDVAASMTNLGNCIPAPNQIATSTSGAMESLDAFFASATELPTSLADTDLTTFDSSVLAATGMIAYVPTYPLWSDGSGKLRHIRVPKGQTVTFDQATQTFSIPPNTRFYKTFFRKVVDRTGQTRNRKMETRVIVARPDKTLPDGTVQQTALFGTYLWSDDETTATLASLRYRDGTTHADQVLSYVTDELRYQEIVDHVGPGADFESALNKALAAGPADLVRHYAIPGRIRCVQCHMGSPTNDFVLGFFPLQIARRENGTGGTYEPTGDDELNQLQRLIDYGVISGMTSPADVLPLEQSQGARHARTDGELNAQAYMVGNCAHCHNPRGLPSIIKPELATALNFLPDGKEGGVFEFPFERMSPVRARGASLDIPVPYITPSLYDYPVSNDALTRLDNGAYISPGASDSNIIKELTWTPKYDANDGDSSCAVDNKFTRGYCGARKTGPTFVLAPWRSLIYRNVDAPFPYFDDYVPFPHMPMNTPGFDCRAPRIMGDWMVGLPAARVKPTFKEWVLPTGKAKRGDGTYDDSPQPYRVVKPDDPAYADAQVQAKARLDQYHASVRYTTCQDILGPDIYDPIGAPPGGYRPDVTRYLFSDGEPPLDPRDPKTYLPAIGVPYHAHWFNYDPTDSPPPWSPKRAEWKNILPPGSPPDMSLPAGFTDLTVLGPGRALLETALNEATLSDELRAYATTEVPFGLWQAKPECQQQLAAQPKLADFAGKQPDWMAAQAASLPASAPVYMSAPGATLYRHICFNCHGPKADGHGLQADALAASSEGEAQPANFREGLFGPSSQPGANLKGQFSMGGVVGSELLWGARYMAWMALGGTLKQIPEDIIRQVQAVRVFGQLRPNLKYIPAAIDGTANMLNLAKGLCSAILPAPSSAFWSSKEIPFEDADVAPFIAANGDKEMWVHLCTRFSPTVVRVYEADNRDVPQVSLTELYYADAYPPGAPVRDHKLQQQTGVHPDKNDFPACIRQPDPAVAARLSPATRANLPDCPAQFLVKEHLMWKGTDSTPEEFQTYDDNVARWKLRGAIATGMAVFAYLQNGGAQTTVKPYYNECQLLKK